MSAPEYVETLVRPLIRWLAEGGNAWELDLAYWKRRRDLMDAGVFPGLGWEPMSNIDTALDVFNPDPDRDPDQIDETQLRVELTEAIAKLKALGFLLDP